MTNRRFLPIFLKSCFLSVVLAEVQISGPMPLFLSAPCDLCHMERTLKELSRAPASPFTPVPFLPWYGTWLWELGTPYCYPEIEQLCVVCNYKSDPPWQADLCCLNVPREAPHPALPRAVCGGQQPTFKAVCSSLCCTYLVLFVTIISYRFSRFCH